jgi:hypothetical protein
MEFRKLLGRRIYLELPVEKVSSLAYIDEETKAMLDAERMKNYGRLKVYAVGSDITDISEGDEVMIDPTSAAKVAKIFLSDEKEVIMVSIFDIAHIW